MEGQQNQLDQNSQQQLEKISTSSYLCRQSSTRWTPTTEQIKLLKELYYNNGVRSPTADQIQAICARLRRYGKIEGKNVFYWFQNHKARERQKKRLTPPTNNSTANSSPHFQNTNNIINNNGGINNCWKQDEIAKYPCITNNNANNNINNGISCSSSSAGVVSGGGFQYGGVTMENKFKDCSISGGVLNGTGNVNNTTTTTTTSQWNPVGGGTYFSTYAAYSNFHDRISTFDEQDHEQDDHHYVAQPEIEIETLPLFPMHNKDDHNNNDNFNNRDHHFPSTAFYSGGYRWSNGGGNNGAASLELSLNSYGYGCYSHNY